MTRGEIARILNLDRSLVTPVRENTICTSGLRKSGRFCGKQATWDIQGEEYCDEHLKQLILVSLAMEET